MFPHCFPLKVLLAFDWTALNPVYYCQAIYCDAKLSTHYFKTIKILSCIQLGYLNISFSVCRRSLYFDNGIISYLLNE